MARFKGKKAKAWEAVKRWSRRQRKDCYTCPAKNLIGKNAQAGHYQPMDYVGSNNQLSWDEHQIRLQCGYCNGVGQGRQAIFRKNLVKEYGEALVKKIDARVKIQNPIKDWEAIIYKFDSL